MKKQLLCMLVAVFTVSELFAASYNVGDFVYTKNGRFKITSANMVTNGDFATGTTAGWTTEGGKSLSVDTFSVEAAEGPTGGPCLKVLKSGGAGTGGSLYAMATKEANSYYIFSYKAKSASGTATTSITAGGTNYQNIFQNTDMTTSLSSAGYAAVASSGTYTNEWTTLTYDSLSMSEGFYVMNFYNLIAGDEFADFGIYKAEKIGDDRLFQVVLDYATSLANNAAFIKAESNGSKGSLLQSISAAKTEYIGTYKTEDEINAIIPDFKENVIGEFLKANAVVCTPYVNDADFSSVAAKASSVSGWEIGGDRWNCSAGVPVRIYPAGYVLGEGYLRQFVNLPKGRYLFTMDLQGQLYYKSGSGATANYYGLYRDKHFTGMKLFINSDSVLCENVPNTTFGTYYMIADVAEDSMMTIGAYNPGNVGQYVAFDNATLYCINGDETAIANYVSNEKLQAARYALKVMIDRAQTNYDSSDYIYGKTTLKTLIDESNNAYSSLNATSDVDSLKSQMTKLQSAIKVFTTMNVEYVTLNNDIANCKTLVADNQYKNGKSDFQAVIDASVAFASTKAADVENRDSLGLANQDVALITARTEFYVANSSYATPGSMALVNGNFKKLVTGWTTDGRTGNDRWKQGTSSATSWIFTDGYYASYDRGNSAHDSKYAWQDVTLKYAGYYEFSEEIVACNTLASKDNANTGVYLFIGIGDTKLDSIQVHASTVTKYTLKRVLPANTVLRVGLDGKNNALCCRILIGSAQLKYFGDYAQYKADSSEVVLVPTKDSLQKVINAAQVLYDEARNPNNVDKSPLSTAIAAAQKIKDSSKDINEVNGAFATIEAAKQKFMTSGVWPATGKYYDLSYMIKNNNFAETIKGWTAVNDTMPTLMNKDLWIDFSKTYVNATPPILTNKISQSIAGLPAGAYQMVVNGTYRLSYGTDAKATAFLFDAFANNHPFSIYAGSDTIKMKGLLDGADSTYCADVLKLTIYNIRHNGTWSNMLDGDLFKNYLSFKITDAAAALELGLSADISGLSSNYQSETACEVRSFGLQFWGDVVTGINNVSADGNNAATVKNAGIYSITGAKIRTNTKSLEGLSKGVYIMDGKKYVVK